MPTYTLPHFGQIDSSNLDEYYDVEVDFNGREIQIDLNFESGSIDTKRLDVVKKFIENLPAMDKKNATYLEADYNDKENDTVKTYVEHHLEEIDKDDLADLIDFNSSVEPGKQLVKALHLVRVGLYPDSEEEFAIFDYSIGDELTDYLVVVNTDENGKLDSMTMES